MTPVALERCVPADFFARAADQVASELIGKVLWANGIGGGRLTEVEAYLPEGIRPPMRPEERDSTERRHVRPSRPHIRVSELRSSPSSQPSLRTPRGRLGGARPSIRAFGHALRSPRHRSPRTGPCGASPGCASGHERCPAGPHLRSVCDRRRESSEGDGHHSHRHIPRAASSPQVLYGRKQVR